MLITSVGVPVSISEQSVTDNKDLDVKIRMCIPFSKKKKNLKTALSKEVNHSFALGKKM